MNIIDKSVREAARSFEYIPRPDQGGSSDGKICNRKWVGSHAKLWAVWAIEETESPHKPRPKKPTFYVCPKCGSFFYQSALSWYWASRPELIAVWIRHLLRARVEAQVGHSLVIVPDLP